VRLVAIGLVAGLFSALFGVGGGIVIVPLLLLTGGWSSMRSVQRARSHVLPEVAVSKRSQDTGYGAARFAVGLLPHQELPEAAV